MIENRFAKILGEKRLVRRDVVKMTGLDNHIILKIYKNEYTRIDLETLNKLCMALECDTNDIFKYIPEE
ncbi:TPA: Cro/Cl family transcriptional regulator [Candidatus Gastranaerophilales bacterium HUM_5]|nr:MAG TPA: Cro/Cl family transcriptional regulator [Candidatus Gastranaerophilales bacterium HUM_4]DAA88262.1 MAG TPA: Cro/Cl family transcriptional regulator [Candidatus Gastranaerophilales bacterium HUM_5]